MNKFKISFLRNSLYKYPSSFPSEFLLRSNTSLYFTSKYKFNSKNNNNSEYEIIDEEVPKKQPKQNKFPTEKSFLSRSAIPLGLLAASGVCFSLGIQNELTYLRIWLLIFTFWIIRSNRAPLHRKSGTEIKENIRGC